LNRREILGGLALLGTVAVAAISIWMIRGGGTSSEPGAATPVATVPVEARQPKGQPAAQAEKPTPSPPVARTVVTTATFTVKIPKSWSRRSVAGGLLLTPPGTSAVSVEVFSENDPSLGIEEMGAKTSAFLRSRDEGAQVSATGGLRVAGHPAFKLRAAGPAAFQTALGVLAGANRYLVIEKVATGAPDEAATQADLVLAGFRPR
jgi:hypothetical protein